MKNKIKKIITSVVLLSTFIVPTIASAGTTVDGGYRIKADTGKYGWAQKSYNIVWAQVVTSADDTGRPGGWCSVTTKTIYGSVQHYGYGVLGSTYDYVWN